MYGGLGGAGAYAGQAQRLGGVPANKVASSSYSPLAPAASSSSRPIGSAGAARINFRDSPFYKIKQFVSPIVQCPEAPTQADRKNATLFVTLTEEQAEQLKGKTHQLRLFCTTHEAHAASLSGRNPAIIEFPLTCEARVNNQTLSTNLRGSKKNIGRVPPPNLNKDGMLSLIAGRPNRIDLTYTNAPKKHALVAAICEITTVDTLVQQLRTKYFRSKEDVLSRMRKEAEDDDIQQGAATISLKCPLSYMRIATPSRSVHCSHVQCFDATSFFSVNEQTPAWACPICNKTVKVDEMIMDGFLDDILKRVPQDEDSVIVEPDGQWRTSDGKVTSGGTGQATPAAEGSTPIQDRLQKSPSEDVKPGSSSKGKANGSRSMEEIVLLDSPSPPPESAPSVAASTSAPDAASSTSTAATSSHGGQPTIKNGTLTGSWAHAAMSASAAALRNDRIELLSSSENNSARASPVAGAGDVIDLTLDSDDEDEPSVPTRSAPTSNGSHPHGHSGNSHGNAISRGGFSSYSATTPNRTTPFAAAAAAATRVQATPEDEQVRRPGKRPRTEAIPTPPDPRLVNGRRPLVTSLPASYLDVGANGSNGSRSNGAGQTAESGAGERGTYRDPASNGAAGEEEGDDSWIDNTNTHDHEQYLDEDDWWSPGP